MKTWEVEIRFLDGHTEMITAGSVIDSPSDWEGKVSNPHGHLILSDYSERNREGRRTLLRRTVYNWSQILSYTMKPAPLKADEG